MNMSGIFFSHVLMNGPGNNNLMNVNACNFFINVFMHLYTQTEHCCSERGIDTVYQVYDEARPINLGRGIV